MGKMTIRDPYLNIHAHEWYLPLCMPCETKLNKRLPIWQLESRNGNYFDMPCFNLKWVELQIKTQLSHEYHSFFCLESKCVNYLWQLQLFQHGDSVHWFFLTILIALISFHFFMTLFLVTQLSIFQHQPHVGLGGIHMQLSVHPRKFCVTGARKLQRAHQRVTQLDLQGSKIVYITHHTFS